MKFFSLLLCFSALAIDVWGIDGPRGHRKWGYAADQDTLYLSTWVSPGVRSGVAPEAKQGLSPVAAANRVSRGFAEWAMERDPCSDTVQSLRDPFRQQHGGCLQPQGQPSRAYLIRSTDTVPIYLLLHC